jgi:hypothetical protein
VPYDVAAASSRTVREKLEVLNNSYCISSLLLYIVTTVLMNLCIYIYIYIDRERDYIYIYMYITIEISDDENPLVNLIVAFYNYG